MKREFVLGSVLALGLLTMSATAMQQPAVPAPMVIEVEKLRDNLYVMKGGGGNSAVFITTTGIVVVDTKSPGGWGKLLLEKIKSVSSKPVTTIINTHTHYDHVSGNPDFPATVEVIAQENTATFLKQWHDVYGRPPQPNVLKDAAHGYPTRTFKDKLSIGAGADRIDLFYVGRAHTGGDAMVLFPALRVLHAGDVFHTRDLPIMDKNNGGSGLEYSATLTKAGKIAGFDTIINGHNPTTTTPADMRIQAEFIADFVTFVQAAKKSGKTVDDVVKTWATPAKYANYAKPDPDRVRADAQVIWEESK